MRKNYSSNVKNFWVFRIAGMLASIGGIRYGMTKKSNNPDVITFENYLTQAEIALNSANNILRKINYTNIVK
jgi:hypothetical protein